MKLLLGAKTHFGNYGFRWKEGASIVSDNPKLLFNISGGVVFEDVISYGITPATSRVASIQTCLRTDGWKDIGISGRHHIVFDMLGHFSLYEKDELAAKNMAIESAWLFLTECAGLNPRNLSATVHPRDAITQRVWEKLGVKTISNKENVALTPPGTRCGFRTEIVWQHPVTARRTELWNLIFTQFQGAVLFRNPLGKIAMDSGASIDRIITAVECRNSNYENSLWRPVVQSLMECSDGNQYTKVCRLVDLGKAATLLISQGLRPGNKAVEYVLRKIIREAYVVCRQASVPLVEFGAVSVNYWFAPDGTTDRILAVLAEEVSRFEQSIVRGRRECERLNSEKRDSLSKQDIEYLTSTIGYPMALMELDGFITKKEVV